MLSAYSMVSFISSGTSCLSPMTCIRIPFSETSGSSAISRRVVLIRSMRKSTSDSSLWKFSVENA